MWRVSFGLVLAMSVAAPAIAQDADEESRDRAATTYAEGLRAVEAGEWETAYQRFRDAYALVPSPRSLFNRAAAEAQTGRVVEAVQSYRRYLADPSAPAPAEARRLLAEVEARLAHLELVLRNLSRDDVVTIDGTRVDPREPVALNAGAHRLEVRRRDTVVFAREEVLAEAEVRRAEHALPEPTPRARVDVLATRSGDDGGDDDDAITSSPWFWVGVVSAVALAVVLTIVLAQPAATECNVPTCPWEI